MIRSDRAVAALLMLLAGCTASSEAPNTPFPTLAAGAIRFVDASERLGAAPAEVRGVSLVDYDGDGRADITLADRDAGVALYRGTEGGQFAPDSDRLPALDLSPATGVVWADVDDDGDLDLLVTHGQDHERAPTLLLQTEAGLVDATADAGLDRPGRWLTATFADLDHDGPLDLILVGGSTAHNGGLGFNGTPDAFLRGHGDGSFSDFGAALACRGAGDGEGWGALAADLDQDGRVDYVIGNDKRSPTLCLTGGGDHADHGLRLHTGRSVMGLAVGDLDGDGCPDLYGTLTGRDMLLSRVAEGALASTYAHAWGDRPDPAAISSGYGVVMIDADADGDQDVAWVSAYENAHRGVVRGWLSLLWNAGPAMPGALADASAEAGDVFGRHLHGYGLAVGDADGDGAPDLLVGLSSTFNRHPIVGLAGGPRLLLNRSPRRRSVWIELSQPPPNRRAVGATVTVSAGGVRSLGVVSAGASYASSHSYRLHFGLGDAEADAVAIRWPDGHQQVVTDLASRVEPGGVLRVTRSSAPCEPAGPCAAYEAPRCRAAPPSGMPSPADCEAACSWIERCGWDGDPTMTVFELCDAACRAGDFSDHNLACVLAAACPDVPACDHDDTPDPLSRAVVPFP